MITVEVLSEDNLYSFDLSVCLHQLVLGALTVQHNKQECKMT